MNQPLGLLPFVPSGPDYSASCALFQDLGFEKRWENGGFAGFYLGPAAFILQRMDNPDFAGNFMVKIEVEDVDGWWAETPFDILMEKYPGLRGGPPKDFPWGREVHFIDLAGVCWHVGAP